MHLFGNLQTYFIWSQGCKGVTSLLECARPSLNELFYYIKSAFLNFMWSPLYRLKSISNFRPFGKAKSMLIEIKLKIGHNSIFNISQANFKSSHLLNKIDLVQSQSGRTVLLYTNDLQFYSLKTNSRWN